MLGTKIYKSKWRMSELLPGADLPPRPGAAFSHLIEMIPATGMVIVKNPVQALLSVHNYKTRAGDRVGPHEQRDPCLASHSP